MLRIAFIFVLFVSVFILFVYVQKFSLEKKIEKEKKITKGEKPLGRLGRGPASPAPSLSPSRIASTAHDAAQRSPAARASLEARPPSPFS